ncbi:MAG TPA: endonuclease domain-containing protein [Armatimonadota bacterium]
MRQAPTSAEAVLWQNVRSNQCAGLHFRRQQVIDGFIADFYCHTAGLVVEVDGPIHETQRDSDAQRDAVMESRGLLVLRFTNEDIQNRITHVLGIISDTGRTRTGLIGDIKE